MMYDRKMRRIIYLILIIVCIIISVYIKNNNGYRVDAYYYLGNVNTLKSQLAIIDDTFQKFNFTHKRYPAIEEGLILLNYPSKKTEGWDAWGIPYIYENRAGLDKKIFKDSPVKYDTRHRYSVKVDEDVYFYSVGGVVMYEKYGMAMIKQYVIIILPLLFAAVFFVLFIIAKPNLRFMHWEFLKVIIAVVLVVGIPLYVLISPAFRYRFWPANLVDNSEPHNDEIDKTFRPEMVKTYQQTIEKYYSNNLIKESTYNMLQDELQRLNNQNKNNNYKPKQDEDIDRTGNM